MFFNIQTHAVKLFTRGAETGQKRCAATAGRAEEESDAEIDGMDLDEDCLVRVGRAGAGGAGAR